MTTHPMNTCKTCRFWDRQPDITWKYDPEITVYGNCLKLSKCHVYPLRNGIATMDHHIDEPSDHLATGPDFGCIHHQEKESFASTDSIA